MLFHILLDVLLQIMRKINAIKSVYAKDGVKTFFAHININLQYKKQITFHIIKMQFESRTRLITLNKMFKNLFFLIDNVLLQIEHILKTVKSKYLQNIV